MGWWQIWLDWFGWFPRNKHAKTLQSALPWWRNQIGFNCEFFEGFQTPWISFDPKQRYDCLVGGWRAPFYDFDRIWRDSCFRVRSSGIIGNWNSAESKQTLAFEALFAAIGSRIFRPRRKNCAFSSWIDSFYGFEQSWVRLCDRIKLVWPAGRSQYWKFSSIHTCSAEWAWIWINGKLYRHFCGRQQFLGRLRSWTLWEESDWIDWEASEKRLRNGGKVKARIRGVWFVFETR